MSDFTPDKIAVVPASNGSTNRGHDNAISEADAPELTITLERINEILMGYLSDVIKPSIDDGGATRPVPVVYGTEERWKTVRKDGVLRDSDNAKLQTPLIMVRRTNVRKSLVNNPVNKYLHTSVSAGWNARNAYDKFAVLNGIRPSQQIRNVMVPDYMDLTYEGFLWTEYQSQMDSLVEQINVEGDEYWGNRNDFKFRVTIKEFSDNSELPATDDRVIRTSFQMSVAAYLLPDRMVQNMKIASTTSKFYTAKKVAVFMEAVNRIENS